MLLKDKTIIVTVLVSDYARMVTGTSLDINGGQYMAA